MIWALFEELEGGEKLKAAALRNSKQKPPSEKQNTTPQQQTETLPASMLNRHSFPERLKALKAVHFPEAGTPMVELMSATTPGHRRLIFEEFFILSWGWS
ncbi:hypothetical protein RBB80_30430 [Tunturiibacter gelidiferens]